MTSMKTSSLESGHQDLINDVAFDYYGIRLATCASDHTVKIWDQDESGAWVCSNSWKAHSGSVWKVTWAHPEFGQVIATCSFDRTATIWEEIVSDPSVDHHENTWIYRASMIDSRTSLSDLRFSPRTMGLQLATVSADGVIRIYEATDPMNLSSWSLEHELHMRCSGSCISWSRTPSAVPHQLLAAGSDEAPPPAVQPPTTNQTGAAKIIIYCYGKSARKWNKVQNLMSVTEKVHDICFAPNMGRSFHLLGIASTDVRIVALSASSQSDTGEGGEAVPLFEIREMARLEDHRSVVWRVAWNITGTILGSSGDDGCVRLWKANYLNDWKCVYKLLADSNSSSQEPLQLSEQTAAVEGGGVRQPSSCGETAAGGLEDGGAGSMPAATALSTAKYYKMGTIKHADQVAWH